ncbi:thiopeptide-type bacteriocin biosynthesis protein [Winogradskyella sp. R77965]|uniref:thiopeptide-type bacteriocin biosynthesis protein n=1 Tax=Winogradskyella sp. R77965 TaxID=3093872 RepID=UPI0037DDCD09
MASKSVQKTFIVGEEWLYYKIYCGVKTADSVLIEVLQPFCEDLLEKQLIDKWFFIRYSDPNPHLRVRFHVVKNENLSIVITQIKVLIMPFINSKQVWDITLGTYKRELERYGKYTIELSESFFYYDSQKSITIIENAEDDTARFLMVFKWVEYLVSLFRLNTQDQLSFLKQMQSSFKAEFKTDKTVTKELNLKYKSLDTELSSNRNKNQIANSELELELELELEQIINNLLKLHQQNLLEVSLSDLLSSYIHMSINRTFRSKQRLYEMMIYAFLHKKNQSKFARYGKL